MKEATLLTISEPCWVPTASASSHTKMAEDIDAAEAALVLKSIDYGAARFRK